MCCTHARSPAIAHEGRALAFAGQSGRGKTTLAALIASGGARIVTDDVLLVDVADRARCRGNAGELRLRKPAWALAETFPVSVARRETADGRLGVQPIHTETGWLDLGAVVVPRPSRESDSVNTRQLSASDALLTLLACPRIHGLRPEEVVRTQFELLASLVRTVPVYDVDVVVPWGPPFRPGIGEHLLRLA